MPSQGNRGQRKILNRKGTEKVKAIVVGTPKGRAKGHFWQTKNLDYEYAGVAIAIHQHWFNNLEEVQEVSGRISVFK